jgi:O-antigen ligase
MPESLRAMRRYAMQPRHLILAALVMTYVWRFHDLAPVLAPFRIAALATVGSWAYLVFDPRARQLRQVFGFPYAKLFIVWVIWIGLMVPLAMEPSIAWDKWANDILKTLAFFFFVASCLTTFTSLLYVMALQVFGAAVLSFFFIKGGFNTYESPVPMYDMNDMALVLNVAMPFVLYYALTAKHHRVRTGMWVVATMVAVSVLMSGSRGGFLTLAIVLLFLAVKAQITWWWRLVPAVALAVGMLALPQASKDRLATILNPQDDYNLTDDQGRIETWKRGMGYLRAYPVTGVGVGNFGLADKRLSPLRRSGQSDHRGAVAHNSYLEVAVETGLPGIFLYLAMFASAVPRLLRRRSRLNRVRGDPNAKKLSMLADFLILAFVGFCVGAFFLSLGYTAIIFLIFSMTAGFELAVQEWEAGQALRRDVRRASTNPLV